MRPTVPFLKAIIVFLMATSWLISHTGTARAQCPVVADFAATVSCTSPLQVQFTNNSAALPGGTIDSYEWDFGDGNTSTATNPIHNYATTGVYWVVLTVYDVSGCSLAALKPVLVYAAPTAAFTFSPTNQCSNVPIQFDATSSTGTGLEYTWDFGDGTIVTETDPLIMHTFNARNNATCDNLTSYIVTLTVTDINGCNANRSRAVTVKRIPQPSLYDVSGYNFSNCHNDPDPDHPEDTLTVNNTTANMACIDSMAIYWGDGTSTHGINPADFPITHIYDSLGVFFLNFIAYGTNGCAGDTTYLVANQANPNVGLSALGPNTGCAPFEMIMRLENYHMNTPGTTYTWDFGDGTPTITWNYNQPFINDTITHIYYTSHCDYGLDYFTVSVTATNTCQTAVMEYPNVRVYLAPIADFEVDSGTCVNEPVQFINTSQNGYASSCDSTTTYTWDFGDGSPISHAVHPSHTYTVPGTYDVTLLACNTRCGCTDTTKQVTITGTHADFDNTIPCFGDPSYFFDLSYAYDDSTYDPDPGIAIINWVWDFGDGTIVTGIPNPSHIYATPDTFLVTLTATNEFGCDSTISKWVYVHNFTVAYTKTDVSCFGYNDGTITVLATGSTDTLYYTLLPPNITNITGFFGGLSAGPYFVRVNDTVCDILTDTIWILEPDPIKIDSVHVDHITCHDDNDGQIIVYASGGTGLIYDLYADSIAGAPVTNISGLFQNLSEGNYYTVVRDSNDCPPDTAGPFFIINPPEMYIDSIQSTNNSCFGLDEGTITVWASGGIPPYTFVLMPDSVVNTTGFFTGLANGTYTVDVIDQHNCVISTIPIDIISPPEITFDTLHTDVTCFGYNDGTITVMNAAGGAAPGFYEISIDGGFTWQTIGFFPNLGPGFYNVVVRDSLGCESSIVVIEVVEPALLQINSFTTVPPTCHGCLDGQITANVIGGTPPYNHSWSNGMFGNPITVGAGTYTDTVTDANGCTTFATVILSEPDSLILLLTAGDVDCYGEATGWAAATVAGGTAPYTYEWTRVPNPTVIGTTDTIFNIIAGLYAVTVADIYNNIVRDTIEVHQPDTGLILTLTYSDTVCYGISNGWAKVEVTGGTPSYSYLWGGPIVATTDSIANLGPGVYTITVTDSLDCVEVASLTIHENPYMEVQAYANPTEICSGFTTQLSSSPLGGTPPYSYSWWPVASLSDPFAQNPVATPIASTRYYLQITDARGCLALDSVDVTVHPSPIANFTYNNPCASNFVHFTDESIPNGDSIFSWHWDFGDGNSSILRNPSHFYTILDTTYTVTLIVQNINGCLDTAWKNVYVNPQLGLDIFADSVCIGEETHFSYAVSNFWSQIDSVFWDFGDGNTSTQHSPTHTYALPGVYNVYLNVKDTSGCEEATNKNVIVYSLPVAFFGDSTSCVNNMTYFTDLSVPSAPSITAWFWDFGDGNTSTLQHPSHMYPAAGPYMVTLTVTNSNGCEHTYSREIFVILRPIADFSADTVCRGEIVHFHDQSHTAHGFINSWYWDFGDGATSVLQNPVHTYTTAGIFNVTLIVSNNLGCFDTIIYPIPVYELPEAIFDATTVCESDPTQFTDFSLPNAASIVSWFWDFDDGYTSNQQSPSHIFPGTGTYDVLLRVVNSNGCVDDTIVPVVVDSLPDPDFNYDFPTCVNDTVHFYDLTAPNADSIVAWFWDFDDGFNSTLQNPAHIFGAGGIYHVKLTVTNSNGCVDEITKSLLIHPQPVANFSYDTACVGQTTYFYDLSYTSTGQIIDWYWDFDDPASGANNNSTQQNPFHLFSTAGIYNVMLIVTNTTLCQDTLFRQVVINDPPTANYSYGNVCHNDTAVFYDMTTLSSAPIAAWIWDFGDGTSLSYGTHRDSVTHVFTTSGSYMVTLTVVDSNRCMDDVTKIVVAHPLPVPLFDYTQICENNPTHFTDLSSGSGSSIISWSWDFGDPASGALNYSTLQHPLHQFTSSGLYQVSLTIVNGRGCTNIITMPVEIVPGPVAAFSADSVCIGTPTNFIDISSVINDTITNWFWDFGDGFNSIAQHPSHAYTTPGTYFVNLTVTTANGCMDDITRTMDVNDLPVADFDYAEPNCAGDSTYFTDLSYSIGVNIINSWYWDLGDGNSSTDRHPVHKYDSPGLYNVVLTVHDTNGCSNNIIKQVWVNPRPLAEFTHVITHCDTVHFTDGSFAVGGNIIAWSWNFGDPASGWANNSNLQNPMHVFYGADTFNVQLIITNSHGCLDTMEHLVTLNKPIADFVVDTACVNGGTQFNDLSYAAGSTISGWHWDFDDGTTSTATNPLHFFTAPGWFNVVLTVTSSDGCVSQIMKPCYVHPLPMPDFYADTACAFNETFFTDMSLPLGGITSWSWNFGEPVSGMSNYSTLQNPSHSYLSSGVYNVTLVVYDIHGCEHYIVKPIYVSPEPNVNFTYADNQCAEVPVYFNDLSSTSTGYISQWIWIWGDNTPNDTIHYPNPPNANHTYQNGGNFMVTLKVVTSNDCEALMMRNIHIIQNPLADFFSENSCEDVYINFWDQSLANGGGPIIGWYWDFGDPASGANNNSYLQHPVHIFSTPGTYTVTQIVTNGNYCTDTISREVNVHETPGVDFYSNPACHLTPTQFFVNLTVTNAAVITSYDWDFGDGNTSSLMNPVHTYGIPGIYDVNLTVTDTNGCDNTAMEQIEVYELPVSNFNTYGSMCASDDVYFQDFSIANHGIIEAWIWDFDDGTPPQMIQFPQNPNISHHFGQAGTYGVTLTVFSTDSCMHSFTRNVIILEEPAADFNSSASCEGNPVDFTDISLPGGSGALTNWYWDFGDPGSGLSNTSNSQDPQHTYAYGDSTYYVLLIVENTNNCYDTIVKPVYVYTSPPVDFVYEANCEDILTQFYPDSSVVNIASIATWEWDFGDGSTAYVPNPTHMYQTAATYTVTLTIADINGCESSISHDVTITPLPEALFAAPSHNCMGAPVFFDDNSTTTSGYITSYYWDFGDGTDTTIYFPGNPDISHLFTFSGTYQVTLTVTTSDNCQNYTEQTVNIDLAPIADFENEGQCSELPVQFYDLSQQNGGGYVISWDWNFGDPSTGIQNQSTTQNPEHLFSASGTYNVTLIVFNAEGCGDTIVQTVEVSPPAPVDYTHDGHCHLTTTYFYIDETITDIGAITSFTWDFGDGTPTSSVMNPEHVYDLIGYYDVVLTVTDTNGCSSAVMHPVEITAIPSANFTYESTCVEDITNFYDNSTINGEPISSWYWDFGDPASGTANNSTVQNPEHDYQLAGTYNVKLIVTSASGCQDSLDMALDIIPAPVAGFTYEVNPCENGLVYFTDSSFANLGEITSWLWTFEPGHYSSDPNPVYVFSQTNTTFTVTLVVEDESGCTGTIEHEVFVPLGLQVELSSSDACLAEAMEFGAYISSPANDSIVEYLWNFGDPMNPSAQSTSASPSYTYPIPGTFTVSLEATDRFGCVETTYQQVVVDPLPVPDFSVAVEQCDSNFYFTDLSSGAGASIVTWKWNFGDGSAPVTIQAPNTPDMVHLYAEQGTYNASLIVTNANGCTDTIMKEVTRGPCVIGNFTLSDTLCCQGNIITFVDSSTMHEYIYLYEWDFDDGTDTVYTQEAHVILHKFTEARNHKVRLVVHANVNDVEFKDTSMKIVRVKTRPIPEFACPDACLGDWSVFTDKSETPMGYIKAWNWEFGDDWQQSTSQQENPAYQYSETGEYVVQLTVRNTYGCTDSIKHIVNVNAIPEADFSFESVCLGDPVHFWDESDPVEGNIAYWRWDFGDTLNFADTSKIKNPYYTYKRLGEHTVELVVANEKGCLHKIEKDVEVHPNPLSQFDIVPNYQGQQGDVLADEDALGADGYEWNWGDGSTTWGNEMPVMHTYEQDGEYSIQLVVWNDYGCMDTSYHDYEFMFKALYVPNAFAPTGNNNKVKLFKPKGRGLDIYICEVFDTWGNRLWSSELVDEAGRPVEGWDGTFRNKQMPCDVYIWRIKAVFRDGTVWDGNSVGNTEGLQQIQQGTVTLIQ